MTKATLIPCKYLLIALFLPPLQAALKAFEKDVANDLTLTVKDTSYQHALLRQKKKEWEEEEKEKQAAKDRREAAMISSAIARAHAALPQVGEKKGAQSAGEGKPPPPPNPWTAMTSPDGYTYYYNAITGGMRLCAHNI